VVVVEVEMMLEGVVDFVQVSVVVLLQAVVLQQVNL